MTGPKLNEKSFVAGERSGTKATAKYVRGSASKARVGARPDPRPGRAAAPTRCCSSPIASIANDDPQGARQRRRQRRSTTTSRTPRSCSSWRASPTRARRCAVPPPCPWPCHPHPQAHLPHHDRGRPPRATTASRSSRPAEARRTAAGRRRPARTASSAAAACRSRRGRVDASTPTSRSRRRRRRRPPTRRRRRRRRHRRGRRHRRRRRRPTTTSTTTSRRRRRSAASTAGEYAERCRPTPTAAAPTATRSRATPTRCCTTCPGSRYYNVTIAEVCFDTDEHAEAAGFTKPGTATTTRRRRGTDHGSEDQPVRLPPRRHHRLEEPLVLRARVQGVPHRGLEDPPRRS